MSEAPAVGSNDVMTPDDLRQMGNHQFSQGNYTDAMQLYTRALEQLGKEYVKNSGETPAAAGPPPAALLLNLCNRSACYFQMELYEEAKQDADMAWTYAPQVSNIKAAYRLSKTYIALWDFDKARQVIEQAISLLGEDDTKNNQLKSFQDLLMSIHGKKTDKNARPQKAVSIRDFTVGEELGFGNFSEIYQVKHKKTNKEFSLKKIVKKKAKELGNRQHPNVFNEIAMERRILCERLCYPKGTTHPNIVQMQAAFEDYETYYYLMDLHVECGDLWSRIKYRKSQQMVGCHRSQIKEWMLQLVDAVEHMHKHGVVHRDLKPENILLNSRNQCIVIDFGTAKDLLWTDLNGPEFVGTPDFMSPEAVKGGAGGPAKEDVPPATTSTDLWALGAINFILHTGSTPFWSASPFLTFLRIKRCNLLRPWGIADDDAWDFTLQLMKLDPKDRLGADCYQVDANDSSVMKQCNPKGYNLLREHPYLKDVKTNLMESSVPSLLDLCIQAVAQMVVKDSQSIEICDKHPPGDKSAHDMMRLDPRSRRCVMHILDKQKMFKENPRLYERFFDDIVKCRLGSKYREDTRDFVGLTKMTDGHGKPLSALNEDPYATPLKSDAVKIAVLSNQLFLGPAANDEIRKQLKKDLKKAIAAINRERPKLVVVSGYVDECLKLLARISDSIPVAINDANKFYTIWHSGVQCLFFSSANSFDLQSPQSIWIREELETSRMSKHPLFCFCDCDPRDLPDFVLKRFTRGKTYCLSGLAKNDKSFSTTVSYTANEKKPDDDDRSIRSDNSEEDDKDEHTMKMTGCSRNAIQWITIEEEQYDNWESKLEIMES